MFKVRCRKSGSRTTTLFRNLLGVAGLQRKCVVITTSTSVWGPRVGPVGGKQIVDCSMSAWESKGAPVGRIVYSSNEKCRL
jgi:hypothetical protein